MGRFRNAWCGALAAGLMLVPSVGAAQGRQITGTVTRVQGGQPVAEAVVTQSGTLNSVRTGVDGTFRLQVPAGEVRLTVRAIGFTRKDVVVGAGESTVTVALAEDVFKLDEVVVTGQATTVERRSATTSIAFVSGDEVAAVSGPSIEHALNGKVAGINLQTNSGAPGGGIQMQIRGNTTVLGSSDPLYVVDGVIYSNARINGGRSAAVAGASVNEDDPVNRLADINPSDIASIEVLKGAAASSIYGSKASNGVVVIKTIRGQAGRTRANVIQRLGFFDLQRDLESRNFTDVNDATAVFGAGAAPFFANGVPKTFDLYDQVFGRNQLSYETIGDVSGGDGNTKYFVSGTWKRDEGIMENTGASRQGIRVNVDQRLSDKLDVSASSVFNRSLAERGFTNNGNVGSTAGYALAYQPNFQSLLPNPDGSFTDVPLNSQNNGNPVQTAKLARNEAETNRFTAGATLNWSAYATDRSSLRLTAQGGADIFNQQDFVFTPNELFTERVQSQPGTALRQNANSRQTSWNLSAIHTTQIGGARATTSAGVRLEDRQLRVNRITNVNLLPGQSNVTLGTLPAVAETFSKERTFGFYAAEDVLLFDERLLVSGGITAERSSVNGNDAHYFAYPRVSGSWRFVNVGGAGNEVKVRGAYGETGNLPPFGQKFTTLNTPQINGVTGLTVSTAAGAPNVKPERLKEFEAGVDATLFGGRLSAEVSFYTRNTNNLLLQRVPAPSTGFTSEVFNGGKVRNRGVEIGLGVTPVQTGDLQIVTRGTFTLNRNKVLDLPVTPFRPPQSGFGGLGVTFVEQGQPMTQIIGFGFQADGVTRTATQVKLGDAAPDFRVGFTSDVTYKALNFSMVWDWQQGGDVINLTQFLYDDGQNASDFGSPGNIERLKAFNAGVMTPYIEDGTFLKLRELSIGVNLPRVWVQALGRGLRDARVSLTGRNLLLFTKYSGLDPEVANFGSAAIRNNLDVAPFPPSRSVFFNLALGF